MATDWSLGTTVVLLLSVVCMVDSITLITDPLHTGTSLSSVLLKCSYTVPDDNRYRVTKIWNMISELTGKEELVFSETDLEDGTGFGRYKDRVNIVGSQADLNIVRLEVADTGDYLCSVNYYVEGAKDEVETRLEVYSLTDSVDILDFSPGADFIVPVGHTQEVTCRANLATPAAKLYWYIGFDNMGQGEEVIRQNSDGTYNTDSIYSYTGKPEDDGKVLKCESNQEPEIPNQYKSDTIRIRSAAPSTTQSSLLLVTSMISIIVTTLFL